MTNSEDAADVVETALACAYCGCDKDHPCVVHPGTRELIDASRAFSRRFVAGPCGWHRVLEVQPGKYFAVCDAVPCVRRYLGDGSAP